MRLAFPALAFLAMLAACGREETRAPAIDVPRVDVSASDELPGLAAPATGIAFWTHPNVAFNGLIIVASADGVVGYNIEDGAEVSRIPGVKARGAAVSYLGHGAQARGLLAFFDEDADGFKIHAIDNAARSFQPIAGDIPIRGAVRGYCFGRALDAEGPTLYVVQKGLLTPYGFSAEDSTVKAKAETAVKIPDDAQACAVDGASGDVILARKNGDIHRIAAGAGGPPIAMANIGAIGGVAVLLSESEADQTPALYGHIVLLDAGAGRLHVFNSASGEPIGEVSVAATNEIEAVTQASVMGAAGANLGGLYRNGAIALGVDSKAENSAPTIRLLPVNGLMNALGAASRVPVDPRGATPEPEDNGLIIDTSFQPE